MGCPFCSVNKSMLVRDGKNVYVRLSDPRLMDGHLLVISKRHVERLSELNAEEREELLAIMIEFQEKITGRFATGCDIRQNYRPFLLQGRLKVDHLHIHLLPREFEDELYKRSMIHEQDIFRDLTEEERVRFVKLFGL